MSTICQYHINAYATPRPAAAVDAPEEHMKRILPDNDSSEILPGKSLASINRKLGHELDKHRGLLPNDHQRQIDLIRYMRSELLSAGLITIQEYTALLIEKECPGAVKRLESYDNLVLKIRKLEQTVKELEDKNQDLTVLATL